jgi:hypothetical protein
VLRTSVLAVLAVLLAACGGDDNGSIVIPTGITASFTADAPAPATPSVVFRSGAVAGATIDLRVTVAGVPDFFGATFHVSFDPSMVTFGGCRLPADPFVAGPSGQDPVDTRCALATSGHTVAVSVTRLASGGQATGIDAVDPSDLVLLSFTALQSTAGTRLDFSGVEPRMVVNSSAWPGSEVAGVSWAGGTLAAH